MTRAIGLLSGGLDSMLAARLMTDQNIEVLGMAFVTPFFGPEKARQAAEQLRIPLQVLDITQPHWAMLRRPRYGYGKGLNPCIDCHALMLHEAGKLRESLGADFLFTGEVLGQRPFSQTKPSLRAVEKASGLPGSDLEAPERPDVTGNPARAGRAGGPHPAFGYQRPVAKTTNGFSRNLRIKELPIPGRRLSFDRPDLFQATKGTTGPFPGTGVEGNRTIENRPSLSPSSPDEDNHRPQ